MAPYLFVLMADIFVMLIQWARDIIGLELPGGMMLKAMLFAEDSHLISITTTSSLDACAVIDEYDEVSGMTIDWEKTHATCSPILAFVRVLHIGEIEKYLGCCMGQAQRTGEWDPNWSVR